MPLSSVEQFLAAGAYLKARREAERLLSEPTLPPCERGRLHQLAGRAAFLLQDHFAAVRHGQKALGYAQESADGAVTAPTHFDLGMAYTQIGDGHLAASHLHAFLAEVPPAPSWQVHIGAAYCSLALVARQRKQWSESMAWLHKAREWVEPRHRAQVELDLAWCHLMLHLPDLASTHLSLAEQYLESAPGALTACLLYHRALYHRLKGDLATSSALCQELFTPGRRAAGDLALAYAAWIMGENALDLGHASEALLLVELALSHAVRGNLPPVMNLAGDLRRRVVGALPAT